MVDLVLKSYDELLEMVVGRFKELADIQKENEYLKKEVTQQMQDLRFAKQNVAKLMNDLKIKDKELASCHEREAKFSSEVRVELLASAQLIKTKNELEVVLGSKRRLEREVDCANAEIERIKRQKATSVQELALARAAAGEEIQVWQRRCFDAERKSHR